MPEQTLKITLTADNKQALAALQQTVTSLNGVAVASGKAGTAVGKTTKDFTGFSRVIQDLPYGFNAISNNLTQIIPAAGAAGLAFSALVTAFTFFQIGFGAWTRGLKGGSAAMKDFAATLGSLNDVMNEAAKTAAEEGVKARLLYQATQDVNLSMKERLQAAKQLQELYPQYLSNFSTEAIVAGQADKAYQSLTKSIIDNARAKAATAKITELETEKLKAQYNIQKIQAVTAKELAQATAKYTDLPEGGSVELESKQEAQNRVIKRRNEALKEQTDLISSLTAQQDFLAKAVGVTNQERAQLDFKTEKKGVDEVALAWERWNREIERYIENGAKLAGHQLKQETIVPGIEPVTGPGKANLTDNAFNQIQTQVSDSAYAADKALADYNKSAAEALQITNALAQPFTDLANAMLQGQDLGEALGNTFKKLAADIAAAAIKAAIFSVILNSLTGGTSGGVGAILGGGNGFGSLFGKFLGFASGGTASGPESGYPVLLHGTESILRPDQLGSLVNSAMKAGAIGAGQGGQTLETRVAGNDLFILLQRTIGWRNLRT